MVQLDALRAIAVALVLIFHFWPASRAYVLLGPIGVRLFFVLSGFLITGILLKSRELVDAGEQGRRFALGRFYVRRFLRIFPLYYLALLIVWTGRVSGAREGIWWHVSYLSNLHFFLRKDFGRLGHLWSLAVEEQFYLFWPCVILFTPRRWLPAVTLGAIAIGPVFRLVATPLLRNDFTTILPFGCLDSLGLGAYLALATEPAFRSHPLIRQPTSAWAWAGALVFLVHQVAWYLGAWPLLRIVMFDLGVAFPGVWLVKRSSEKMGGLAGRILEFAPLRYVGTISYGIYVYHPMVPSLFTKAARHAGYPHLFAPLGDKTLRFALFYSAASIAIAAISWHWFEAPINRLKARFEYHR
jgi:peptidoglycan/LPS O-acetylase OafA/YrhL